ncbi:glutamine synthetase III [bacterium]|nr:glutamine synthetase III [bacterium]
MSVSRQKATSGINERAANAKNEPGFTEKITDIFGEQVFNDSVMKERLPEEVYKKLKKTMIEREPLDPTVAEVVASTMKNWALDHGATHFTHWFHPLTGSTAEKHDAFIVPKANGQVIFQFSGKELSQGEPDASSFPSGGLRQTFEARGYTAWDPTSPAFIRKTKLGAVLCIPTAFCSYTGEALDKKTPLLRSSEALSNSATNMLKLLGVKDVSYVDTAVGLEQEYFLIDQGYYNQRPDLVATGRTLFGAESYKGQSLDDHYFGAIRERVQNFMHDSEQKLYRLGIPVKTRHNEVAPGQYEIAPVFETANLAIDHNMLIMEVMNDMATKCGLKFLTHEKPFAGINGSGKHCNWSMMDSNGNNLLKPGDTPSENVQFIVFLAAIVRAVDKYASLLRLSVALPSNDHRLGANEAPPAIISIFLGEALNAIVEALIAGEKPGATKNGTIKLGAETLPEIPKDNTDRNRTSPFAFTGNRFEFRALGSSQHAASPVMVLNTITADSLDFIAENIKAKLDSGTDFDSAVSQVLKDVFSDHQRIIFNGDNYTEEWEKEAAKRGLLNLKSTPEATTALKAESTYALYAKYNVLSKNEVDARYNIKLEKYVLKLDVEFKASLDMACTMILPAALKHQKNLADSLDSVKSVLGSVPAEQKKVLEDLSSNINSMMKAVNDLKLLLTEAPTDDHMEHAIFYKDKAIPAMNKIRKYADELELSVEDELWPLPKYREMLLLL